MKKLLVIVSICLCFAGRANAQWVVSDPGNLAQSIINSAKEMVETAGTKANTLNGFLETQKIFQQSKRFYDALKSVHDVVKGGVKVGKSIALVAEISEIYVRNFQNMLTACATSRTCWLTRISRRTSLPPYPPATPCCWTRVRTCCRT